MKKNLIVVSNMYPCKKYPYYGVFVKKYCEQLDNIGIPHVDCFMKKKEGKMRKLINYFIFYIRSFSLCLITKNPIVYIHYPSHSSYGVLLAKKIKKFDLIVNVHGSDVEPKNNAQKRMHKYTHRSLEKAKIVVVPSEYFRKLVSKKYSISGERIYVYPSGGVDPHMFYPSLEQREKICKKYKLNPGKIYIGYAGRMVKGKGWDVFVDACAAILENHPEVRVILVGAGEEREQIVNAIKKNNIEDRVDMFPMLQQSELAEIYRILELFVFPSVNESLGLVGLEAMASGNLVITCNNTAPGYYIIDNYNGYSCKPGDTKEFVNKIEKYFLLSSEERKKIRHNSRITAEAFYSDKTENILYNIINDNNFF